MFELPTDRLPTEHEEQIDFVRWFRRRYPDDWIFAIPNGENREKATGARLKAEGVEPGVPDLCVPSMNIFIEMKRQKKGVTSKDQKKWIKYLKNNGYRAFVCKGSEAAKSVMLSLEKD